MASAGDEQGSYFRPEAAEGRESVPLDPRRAAVLFVDVQRYNMHPEGAVWRARRRRRHGDTQAADAEDAPGDAQQQRQEEEQDEEERAFFARVRACLPRWRQLLSACRETGAEPVFTVIRSLTRDGRDRGLDYKLSGMHVPPGSADAAVLEEIAPGEKEEHGGRQG